MFKRKSGITLAIQRNDPVIRPGQRLSGVVTITGGRRDEQAKSLDVKVTTCSDNDTYVDDDDSTILGETHVADAVCAADFDVPSGGELRLPFEIDLPTYVPVTTLAGNRLPNALVASPPSCHSTVRGP